MLIDSEQLDVLMVSGGTTWQDEDAPDISDILRAVRARGKTIAAICGATLALARAGLLDDVPHTSNAPEFLSSVPGYAGGGRYVDRPEAVSEDGIITAAGTAPVSFMKEIMQSVGKGGAELDHYTALFGAEHRVAA